mgnify:CR=1 FL=1
MKPNKNFERQFSEKGLCGIIKSCSEAQVSKFTFGDLTIWVGPQSETTAQPANVGYNHFAQVPQLNPETELSEIQKLKQSESLLQDELALKEDRLAQMFIEDPVQAERLLLDGAMDEEEPEHGTD